MGWHENLYDSQIMQKNPAYWYLVTKHQKFLVCYSFRHLTKSKYFSNNNNNKLTIPIIIEYLIQHFT